MKNKIYILSLLVSIIFISACSSTTKITVYGKPGTEIRTPENDYLCTINDTGKGIAELNRDTYYAFLLSKSLNSNEYIPFGLDYSNHNKGRFLEGITYGIIAPLTMIGSGTALIGSLVALLSGDDEILTIGLIGGGLGLGAALSGMSLESWYTGNPDLYHGYEYKKQQSTNNDFFNNNQIQP